MSKDLSAQLPLLKKLLDRFGNPLEWSYLDKTLLVLTVNIVVNLSVLHFLLSSNIKQDFPKYINQYHAHDALLIHSLFLLLWVIIFYMAFKKRAHEREIKWVAYIAILNLGAIKKYLKYSRKADKSTIKELIGPYLFLKEFTQS